MSVETINTQISKLKSEVRELENNVMRLRTAKINAETYRTDMSTHKNIATLYKDSINAVFGSFSWEGQTVADFKGLFSDALDYLNDTILFKYDNIISDISDRIDTLNSTIAIKRNQITSITTMLSRLTD